MTSFVIIISQILQGQKKINISKFLAVNIFLYIAISFSNLDDVEIVRSNLVYSVSFSRLIHSKNIWVRVLWYGTVNHFFDLKICFLHDHQNSISEIICIPLYCFTILHAWYVYAVCNKTKTSVAIVEILQQNVLDAHLGFEPLWEVT